MVGKGSVNHNSRVFKAKNVDGDRTENNIDYCNENIKDVYKKLFDDALEKYNAKQTRADRRIENYYEKIRSSKQEKTFHEIILQIGNCEDMNAQDENGQLAKQILDEYYQDFQQRNPNLYVFSAHLHMDEATPHLHIDFIPFTTGSKRGLETRVSLKQALAKQGFTGGSKHDTEWNQWVHSEKERLAKVMEQYGIEWEQKGTHEKHLSVYDYEKKMRAEEVKTLEKESEKLQTKVDELNSKISDFKEYEDEIEEFSNVFYEEDEYQLPDPPPLMTAKTYKTKFVEPLIKKLVSLAKTAVKRCFEFKTQLDSERLWYGIEKAQNKNLKHENNVLKEQNESLNRDVQNYKLLRKVFGNEQIDNLLEQAKSIITQSKQRDKRFRNNQNER